MSEDDRRQWTMWLEWAWDFGGLGGGTLRDQERRAAIARTDMTWGEPDETGEAGA